MFDSGVWVTLPPCPLPTGLPTYWNSGLILPPAVSPNTLCSLLGGCVAGWKGQRLLSVWLSGLSYLPGGWIGTKLEASFRGHPRYGDCGVLGERDWSAYTVLLIGLYILDCYRECYPYYNISLRAKVCAYFVSDHPAKSGIFAKQMTWFTTL